MPSKRRPRVRICEFCGGNFGKERGPSAKTCSEECQMERNNTREKARYQRVKATPEWQAVRAEYLEKLQGRKAADPAFAEKVLAQSRISTKKHWDALAKDATKIEQYRSQRRAWHRRQTPEQRTDPEKAETMPTDQFDALAQVARLRPDSQRRELARLVLVDGLTQAAAAAQLGATRQAASNAVRAARDGLALARQACGVQG